MYAIKQKLDEEDDIADEEEGKSSDCASMKNHVKKSSDFHKLKSVISDELKLKSTHCSNQSTL